jgi:uncharacterized protein
MAFLLYLNKEYLLLFLIYDLKYLMKKIIFLFIVTILFLSFNKTFWFNIDNLPKKHTYVFDQAGIFNENEEKQLYNKLKNIDDSTTAEIFLISINSLENQDISQLWVKIWEHLWVWKKDVDNGLVILIAPNDRQWNISTGYWLEWILPDIRTKHIWERYFPQYFRENKYYQWISLSLDDINWFLVSDESIISKYNSQTKNTGSFEDNIVFIIFWSLFLSSFIYRKKEKKKIRFTKFVFLTILTSIIVYLFISSSFVIINIIIQSILALLVDKSWNWNYSSWNWWNSRNRSGTSRSRSFGWWSFGWGGSKWKW